MKKRIALLLVAIMLVAILPVNVLAANTTTITASPNKTEANIGEQVEVTFTIANNPGFSAATFDLDFDANMFEFKGLKTTDNFGQPVVYGLLTGAVATNEADKPVKKVTWASATNINVDNILFVALFEAVGPGTGTVSLTVQELRNTAGTEYKDTVTVIPTDPIMVNAPAATSLTLDKESLTMNPGDSETLTAILEPPNAGEIITWSSSDPTVASVDNYGLVTALSQGTTTVTATAGNLFDSCFVTVNEEGGGEQNYRIRTLTFEDADYKGDTNYAGGNDWTSLVDSPQYDGPLLYPEEATTSYNWHDKGNTELAHIFTNEWGDHKYWGGGHAISNYASGDFKKYGDFMNQLTVYDADAIGLARSGGGYNGSDNFAIHFGYVDSTAWSPKKQQSFYFADNVARVIDHMYVNNICYAVSCYVDSNELTPKIGPDDWVKLVATGHKADGTTATSEFYMCNGPDNIVMDWTKWDLSGLGAVTKVEFNVTGSSDNGYGYSQPAYFAYDNVAVRMSEEEANLQDAKEAAIAELENYKNADDYREAEQEQLASIIQGGKVAIKAAANEAQVAQALAEAKEEIDALKTAAQYEDEEAAQALQEAKNNAITELNNYKDPDDYRDAEKAQLASFIQDGTAAINAASSQDQVAQALATAKTQIDGLKTAGEYEEEEAQALQTAKNNAITELNNYKNPDDYRDAEKTQLANYIQEGTDAINAATSQDQVAQALATAKGKIDQLKTDAQLRKEEEDLAAAQTVMDQIDAIGEVTLEKEEQIQAARAAYNALTPDQKRLVNNLQTLEDAERELAALKDPSLQLKEKIAQAEAEKREDYSFRDYLNLRIQITRAKLINSSPWSTDADRLRAIQALEDAMAKSTAQPDDPEDPEDPDQPGDDETPASFTELRLLEAYIRIGQARLRFQDNPALREAVEEGQAVLNSPAPTSAQVQAATNKIRNAR